MAVRSMGPSSLAARDTRWIKETREVTVAVLKSLSPEELAAERSGYEIAASAGIPTAHCYGIVDGRLVLEYIDGVTCHRAIALLRRHDQQETAIGLIESLWNDVTAFQRECGLPTVSVQGFRRAPYDVRTKLPAALALLDSDTLSRKIRAGLSSFVDWFGSQATVPFRDANPKNCLLADTRASDLADSPENLASRRRHIDFRSTLELTTPADDFLSLILHPDVPSHYREQHLKRLRDEFGPALIAGTSLVRVARLWGRREFYHRTAPDLYRKRYGTERYALRYFHTLLLQVAERPRGLE